MITLRPIFKLPPVLLSLAATSLTIPAHANSYQPDFGDHSYNSGEHRINRANAGKERGDFNSKMSAGSSFDPSSVPNLATGYGTISPNPAGFTQEKPATSFAGFSGEFSWGRTEILALKQWGNANFFAPASNHTSTAPGVTSKIEDKIGGEAVPGSSQNVTIAENIPSTNDGWNGSTPTTSVIDAFPVAEGSPATGTLLCYVLIGFAVISRRLFGLQLR